MKPTWACPKCKSDRIGYLETVIDQDGQHGDKPRAVGVASTGRGLLGLNAVDEAHGQIEAFVCTTCGYLEEYVKDPTAVLWDQLKGFRWCRPPG